MCFHLYTSCLSAFIKPTHVSSSNIKHRDTGGKTGRCDCLCCVQSRLSFITMIPPRWVHGPHCAGSTHRNIKTVQKHKMTLLWLQLWQPSNAAAAPNTAAVLFCLCFTLLIKLSLTSEWIWFTSYVMSWIRMTSAQLAASHSEAVWYPLWMIMEYPQVSQRLKLHWL